MKKNNIAASKDDNYMSGSLHLTHKPLKHDLYSYVFKIKTSDKFTEEVNKFLKGIFGDWIEVTLSESGRQDNSMVDFDISDKSIEKLFQISKDKNHRLYHLITNDNTTYWKPLWDTWR